MMHIILDSGNMVQGMEGGNSYGVMGQYMKVILNQIWLMEKVG